MDRYGKDLAFPLDPDAALRATPTGDLPTVEGKAGLLLAQQRRALVIPGTLVHQPEYGGGLLGEVGRTGDIATRARIQAQIRRNALRDDRVAEALVSVGPPEDGTSYHRVEIVIKETGDSVGSTVVVEE